MLDEVLLSTVIGIIIDIIMTINIDSICNIIEYYNIV